jgi:hypothetical protein
MLNKDNQRELAYIVAIDEMREGLVFRDRNGEKSFKAVSNEFLLKYHQ